MQSKLCTSCKKLFLKTPNLSQKVWEESRKYCSNRCKVLGKQSPKKGKQYPYLWRDDVGYGALHLQVYKKYGKAKKCIKCGSEKNIEWANRSNNYKNVDDFISMCCSCHRRYDREMNGTVPWNKGKKGLQTAWNKGVKGKNSHSFGNTHGFPKGHSPWNKVV